MEWPPYDPLTPGTEVIELIRTSGFATIRLPVDPAPFIVFDGERRENVYAILFDAIRFIQGHGLKVIIDLHPASGHPVWGARALVKADDRRYFSRYAELVEDMAGRLRIFNNATIALELINEPQVECEGSEQARWQDMLGALIAPARAANSTLTLIVSGSCMSPPEGLFALDAHRLNDENLIYTFITTSPSPLHIRALNLSRGLPLDISNRFPIPRVVGR